MDQNRRSPAGAEKSAKSANKIAVLALIVSVFGVLVSMSPVAYDMWEQSRGKAYPLPITEPYCIVRGLLNNPSDHVTVTTIWRNTRQEPVLIHAPLLTLSTGDDPNNPLGSTELELVGIYDALPSVDGTPKPVPRTSFSLRPGSISEQVLVFRVSDSPAPTKLRDYQFSSLNPRYTAFLTYDWTRRDEMKHHELAEIATITVPKEVQFLDEGEHKCW